MLNINPIPNTLLHCRRVPLALLMITICVTFAGCASFPPPISRQLPPVPERLMSPVQRPSVYRGEDARAALRMTGSALDEANARLSASAGWYENVRRDYGGK